MNLLFMRSFYVFSVTLGSMMFAKDFLINILVKKFNIKNFGGAFILDCVGNWDPSPDSQVSIDF